MDGLISNATPRAAPPNWLHHAGEGAESMLIAKSIRIVKFDDSRRTVAPSAIEFKQLKSRSVVEGRRSIGEQCGHPVSFDKTANQA
jgi:hypothetical protein